MKESSGNIKVRIIFGIIFVLGLCLVGGFASIQSPQGEVPQPWGVIRHTSFSTNNNRLMAHFRFKSNFPFDVFSEVAVETKSQGVWNSPRGAFAYEQLSSEVKAGMGQDFSVKVPKDCEAWRVVMRSVKATLAPADERRAKLKGWLESHGAMRIVTFLRLDDPDKSYVTPGPEMKVGRNGQLPTAR